MPFFLYFGENISDFENLPNKTDQSGECFSFSYDFFEDIQIKFVRGLHIHFQDQLSIKFGHQVFR